MRSFAGNGGGDVAQFGVGGNIWRTSRGENRSGYRGEGGEAVDHWPKFLQGVCQEATRAGKMKAPSLQGPDRNDE